MVNFASFYIIADSEFIYMILHICQAFGLSGTTFVIKVCIKFEYVYKPVFCEHNLPVETTYIPVTKLGRKGHIFSFHFISFILTHSA